MGGLDFLDFSLTYSGQANRISALSAATEESYEMRRGRQ